MTCNRARKLFGAYWDDDITQAEREWLDGHLVACTRCRDEYDALAQTLELVASLPRVEADPALVERTVAAARRTSAAPDRLPEPPRTWIPITASAAAAVLVVTLVVPWAGTQFKRETALLPVAEAPIVMPTRVVASHVAGEPDAGAQSSESAPVAGRLAGAADSLFDHTEDVEFILDAVALRRGRAHPMPLTRRSDDVQLETAVITF